MNTPRTAWTIVCDDVRNEIGNKVSYMGVYQSEIIVAQFPASLSKLCFVVRARTGARNPFKKLVVKILRDDEEVCADAEIDVSTIRVPPENREGLEMWMDATMICAFSPFQFAGPCKISARVTTESEELRAGSIKVRAPQVASPEDKP
jgi:hypothetical protein